jgi:hypothetical protein
MVECRVILDILNFEKSPEPVADMNGQVLTIGS